ncbi:hypothetical protein PoB_007104000 [Plakobranchus ocellatus]|uniref:Uncharacterized protein n=1 Tax=Plakobranchus ocellatus TaxID=259542 RepID=A0AAV4DKJ1_9GAST|nr:hypothetical protein PoB_007104000 [Plakobranchus ocellatus]
MQSKRPLEYLTSSQYTGTQKYHLSAKAHVSLPHQCRTWLLRKSPREKKNSQRERLKRQNQRGKKSSETGRCDISPTTYQCAEDQWVRTSNTDVSERTSSSSLQHPALRMKRSTVKKMELLVANTRTIATGLSLTMPRQKRKKN